MEATKKPMTIQFLPFERDYYKEILKWSTKERPIVITTPRCADGISTMKITTLEGVYAATEGKHVIIRGVRGECYPCRKDIFFETYDFKLFPKKSKGDHVFITPVDKCIKCGTSVDDALLQVKEGLEKKKMTMDKAIKHKSDAGAGYTIGYNAALDEVIQVLTIFKQV